MDHYINPEDPFWQSQPEALSVGITNPASEIIEIHARDGRVLLTIHNDGKVEGELEDAGEAASRFVEFVRELMEVKWEYGYKALGQDTVPSTEAYARAMHERWKDKVMRRIRTEWEEVESNG